MYFVNKWSRRGSMVYESGELMIYSEPSTLSCLLGHKEVSGPCYVRGLFSVLILKELLLDLQPSYLRLKVTPLIIFFSAA